MNRPLHRNRKIKQTKILVILNPEANQAMAKNLLWQIRRELGLKSSQVLITKFPYQATMLARHAAQQDIKTIIAVGGDGTINEILNGIIGFNVNLGIIPVGTANDLAGQYHLPGDISTACAIIKAGQTHDLDVIQVNEWYYCTAGGIGLPCRVAQIADTLKKSKMIGNILLRLVGSKIYILALLLALLKIRKHDNPMTVNFSGYPLSINPLWLMINNQPKLGKKFLVCPEAMNDDNLLNYCLVAHIPSFLKILSLCFKVFSGKHIHQPEVSCGSASEVQIVSEKPVSFLGDGQIQSPESVFHIRIVPGALRLIVPAKYSSSRQETGHRRSSMQSINDQGDVYAMYSA